MSLEATSGMRTTRAGRPIYMDHHATTPALPEVLEAMSPYFTEEFGNPSSATHAYGARAAEAVEASRRCVASLIGARPDEIVFTGGATESDNLALKCAEGRAGQHIVTCAIEHEAVLVTCEKLAEQGWEVTVLPVDGHGLLDPEDVARAITRRTALVSIMMANNEIGTIEPLAEIGRICRERGVLLHSDAVQAAGRIPVDVGALHVDLLSLTAHKMYGPKGVGALYVRDGIAVPSMLHGGGQEGKRRSGTLNVPGIVGFAKAAEIAMRDMEVESTRQAGLRDRLWDAISSRLDQISLNGHPTRRLPNNLNVSFAPIEAEALLTSLRDCVALSSGSACASGDKKGSYVLRAVSGEDSRAARSSIRFGLGRGNTVEHVDTIAEHLARAVERLRSLAPQTVEVPVGSNSTTPRTASTERRVHP